jgi:tetratricopeptide (TPR) repeat protein
VDQSKDHDKAIEDFSQAIKLNPKFSDAYVQRGQLYQYAGQPDRAMTDFTRAIAVNPKNSYAHIKRAEAHVRKGYTRENVDLAIRDLQYAVQAKPSDALTRQMLDRLMQLRQKLP